MVEKNKEEVAEELEKQLDSLEPTQEDFIDRRINHVPFAKVVFWLNMKSRKDDFVYAKELCSFMKVALSHAYNTLRRFCDAGIMERKYVGNLVEFHFIKNNGNPIIWKYLEKAKKTLGLS